MVVTMPSRSVLVLHESLLMRMLISDVLSAPRTNVVTTSSSATAGRLLDDNTFTAVVGGSRELKDLRERLIALRTKPDGPMVFEIAGDDGPAVAPSIYADFVLSAPVDPDILRFLFQSIR